MSSFTTIAIMLLIIKTVTSTSCVYDSSQLVSGKSLCSTNKVFALGFCKVTVSSNSKYIPCVYNRFTNRISWRPGNYQGTSYTISAFDMPYEPTIVTLTLLKATDGGNCYKYSLKTSTITPDTWYVSGVLKFTISSAGLLQQYIQASYIPLTYICVVDCTPTSSIFSSAETVYVKYSLNGTYSDVACEVTTTALRTIESVQNTGIADLSYSKTFMITRTTSSSATTTKSFSKESQVSFSWDVGTELEASGGFGFADVSATVTANIGSSSTSTTSTQVESGVSTSADNQVQTTNQYTITIPGNSVLTVSRGKIRVDCSKGYTGTMVLSYPDYNVDSETMDETYGAVLQNTEIADTLSYTITSL